MDTSRVPLGTRLMRGLAGVAAVLGIVVASCIGLNDWADDVAVQVAPQHAVAAPGTAER